jgi:hypothetical protein
MDASAGEEALEVTAKVFYWDGTLLGTVARDGSVLNHNGERVGQVHTGGAVFALTADGEAHVGRVATDGILYDAYAQPIGRAAENGAIFLWSRFESIGIVGIWPMLSLATSRVDQQLAGGAALVLMLWLDQLQRCPRMTIIRGRTPRNDSARHHREEADP